MAGILHLLVEPVSREVFPELGEVSAAIAAGEPVAVASVIEGPGQVGARRVIWAERAGQRHASATGSGWTRPWTTTYAGCWPRA